MVTRPHDPARRRRAPDDTELGQGACQAILDAWAIGDALAANADVTQAFRTYERKRRTQVRIVTLVARLTAAAGNLDSQLVRRTREQSIALMPPPVLLWALRLLTQGGRVSLTRP